ncbi:MAG: hypothetical protein KatS3mg002_1337 [Candidatus Woesearchaeota archaeon]|nr:MAG: hypothetical protein KatS3mg002_1337 [Candidatus Woesearchaeota archaeon]
MNRKYIFGKKSSGSYITSDIGIEQSLYEYMKFVKKYKALSAKEQIELIEKYHKNSTSESEKKKILDAIIYSNQRMVISIVKREISINHTNGKAGLYLMDYIQEANIGLLKAFEKYKTEYNVLFYTYATYWIRHYLNVFMNTVVEENKIIPMTFKKKINTLVAYIEEKLSKNIIPSSEEIIKKSKINKQEYSILQPYILEIYTDYSINPHEKPYLLESYILINALKINPIFWNYIIESNNRYKTQEYEKNVYNIHKDRISWDKEKAIIDLLKGSRMNNKYIEVIKKIMRDEKVDPKMKYIAIKQIKRNKFLYEAIRKILKNV